MLIPKMLKKIEYIVFVLFIKSQSSKHDDSIFGVIFHILPNIDVNFSLVNHTLQVTEAVSIITTELKFTSLKKRMRLKTQN